IATEAMASLPNSLREGSYALGGTRFQTIWRVLVPAALPALLTAIVLGMARAFGEALAVQMVIGNVRDFPASILDPSATLTLIISFLFILIIRYLSSRRKI